MSKNTAIVCLWAIGTVEGLVIIGLSAYLTVNYSSHWLWLLLLLLGIGIQTPSDKLK